MNKGYNKDSIQTLSDAEHVRHRPGMWIGSLGQDGINHLFNEILDNAVDEVIEGHADYIIVNATDKKVFVEDNGRGVPTGYREDLQDDVLNVIYTKTKSSGKYGDGGYSGASGGTNGVGASVVCALSKHMKVISFQDEYCVSQEFIKGEVVRKKPSESPNIDGNKRGTGVTFHPDFELFDVDSFDLQYIEKRCIALSSLIPGLGIEFNGKYYKEKSKLSLLHSHLIDDETLFDFDYSSKEVSLKLSYVKSNHPRSDSYMNMINTVENGSHVDAITKALTNSIQKITKRKYSTNQVIQGMRLTISASFLHPTFRGQNKSRVHDSSVSKQIYDLVYKELFNSLNASPSFIKYL